MGQGPCPPSCPSPSRTTCTQTALARNIPSAQKDKQHGGHRLLPAPGVGATRWGTGHSHHPRVTLQPGGWVLLPLHRDPRVIAPRPRGHQPWGLWEETPAWADPGWVICHPHPAPQNWGTLGTVSKDRSSSDSWARWGAGRRWGSRPWAPLDARGHALTLLLAFLVAEGAEPAAARKSVSPCTGTPGTWSGVSPGGTWSGTQHQHHGGPRGLVTHGTRACCVHMQGGFVVVSDAGGT